MYPRADSQKQEIIQRFQTKTVHRKAMGLCRALLPFIDRRTTVFADIARAKPKSQSYFTCKNMRKGNYEVKLLLFWKG